MPYIGINTSRQLSDEQREKIKTELGRLITIIPTKTEAATFVDFSEGRTLYKGGVKIDGAIIELRIWHKSEFEDKKKFVEEAFQLFTRELGLKPENMTMNVFECDEVGVGGTLKA